MLLTGVQELSSSIFTMKIYFKKNRKFNLLVKKNKFFTDIQRFWLKTK